MSARVLQREPVGPGRWVPPVTRPRLRNVVQAEEAAAIGELGLITLRRLKTGDPAAPGWPVIARLLRPLDAVNAGLDSPPTPHRRRAMLDVVALLLTRCAQPDAGSYWDWPTEQWEAMLGRTVAEFRVAAPPWVGDEVRPYLAAHAFLLGGFTAFHRLGSFQRLVLCWRLFGRDRIDGELGRLRRVLGGWGYQLGRAEDPLLPLTVAQLMLANGSPHLQDMTTALFDRVREQRLLEGARLNTVHAVQRAVAELGFCAAPPGRTGQHARATGGGEAWQQAADRWYDTSTLTRRVRGSVRTNLLKVGRWLADQHPEAADPASWTRQTCATWIAALDRMRVGDFVQRTAGLGDRLGQPLTAATKVGQISAMRRFFSDCQEWEWLPRRFDPQRALAVPRSIAALLGPNPRLIADDIWAKLLWAGLNLTTDDLPATQSGPYYPFELVRAVTLTWLFSGQRSDEIARLRVGCIRWQHHGTPIPGDSTDILASDAVCLLDVPTHKTGTAFTKPVDPILGQAIDAWQAIRPAQPPFTDRRTGAPAHRRTGESVDLLFAARARRVSTAYINNTIIPMLCRKGGVPAADVRGAITSHRARSTIASQLYNAKEPMTLFELQAWLGHRSPQSTQYYAKISPNTLTRAYQDVGYFARNVRTIEVLVDRDAVASGAATNGEPWQHYDLGHGYCSYTSFEQCQHRMACVRCDFYTPKASSSAQLIEAKTGLQRMLVGVPLTDDERAAVNNDQAAVDSLLQRLADVATPASPTPNQLRAEPGRQLPLTVLPPTPAPNESAVPSVDEL